MSEDVSDFRLPAIAPEPPPQSPSKKKSPQKIVVDPDRIGDDLPANIDAERTILGAVLLDPEAFYEASERIQPDDFLLESHKRIFQRMKDLMSVNSAVDIVTLANELARNKEVEFVGGVAYLASLTEGLPIRPVIEDYIRIVRDKSLLRKVIYLCSAAIQRACDRTETALEVAGALTAGLEDSISGGVHHGLQHVSTMTIEVLGRYQAQSQLTESPGLSFGVEGIDKATGGMQDGEQIVVGCFSGVGKTTLLAQSVAENCLKGHPCAMFLIEPTRDTFLRQVWSAMSGSRYVAATKPWLAQKAERDKLQWAAYQVGEWPLYICDKTNLTLDEQIAMSRLAIHRYGVRLIGIDYLQRLKVSNVDKNDDTRIKMARASMANADLVKNTKCRSIILSQLNRSGGMGAVPSMDKLRETGQIENDAATIVLLHLKYDEAEGHFTDEGAAIIPKQRFGVPCNVKLYKDQNTALWCSGTKEEAARKEIIQPNLYNNNDD